MWTPHERLDPYTQQVQVSVDVAYNCSTSCMQFVFRLAERQMNIHAILNMNACF